MSRLLERREILRALLSAAGGSVLAFSKQGTSVARNSERNFEAVRARIVRAVADGSATGVAVAVVREGRIVWEEGFGWANRELGVKATARTPFCLASLTKPFTTTVLMTLAAEGKLSLLEPANRYLAESKIEGSNGDPNAVTVQRLGAHVSGLPTMFEQYFRNKTPTTDVLLRNYGRLAYPPGSVYEYGNIGFAALGAIAAARTNTNFGVLLSQRVLKPLGLTDSFFDTDVARLSTGATRYDSAGRAIPYYTTSTPASGELYASAHDLARFAMFNMKSRATGQRQILGDSWIDELHKPVFTGPSGVATTFGWFSGHLKSGDPVVFKTGGQPGVATLLYMIPSEKLAVLVLTNRSNGQELTHELCNRILETYLRGWTAPKEDAGPAPSAFTDTRDFSGHWEGTLTNDGANMRARLTIDSSDSAALALGDKPAEKISEMQAEGIAFTGTSTGVIESPDAIRGEARTFKIKLIPDRGRLVGRIIAEGGKPNAAPDVMLPYVLDFHRST